MRSYWHHHDRDWDTLSPERARNNMPSSFWRRRTRSCAPSRRWFSTASPTDSCDCTDRTFDDNVDPTLSHMQPGPIIHIGWADQRTIHSCATVFEDHKRGPVTVNTNVKRHLKNGSHNLPSVPNELVEHLNTTTVIQTCKVELLLVVLVRTREKGSG